jgi:hypothetical protein
MADMSAKTRALPETQLKLKDAGLDPTTASKHALGGKNGGGVPKSETHKSNIRKKPKSLGKPGCNDLDKLERRVPCCQGSFQQLNRRSILEIDPS